MNKLIEYLREQMILDFVGDLTAAQFHGLLDGDETAVAAALRARVNSDRAVNDLLIVLADVLLGRLPDLSSAMREQLEIYAAT